jgi:class 3 adenylate cyclase
VTNLAARLAETAKAHQIFVGPETVRRLGDGYQVESLGCQHLKNLTDAIDLYLILGSANG